MLQAMRGRLAEAPRIQTIPTEGGGTVQGLVLKLHFQDSRPGAPMGECQVIAWNDQAVALSRFSEGDEIEFIGRLNSNRIGQNAGLSFTLVRLDETKTLVAAMEQFLTDFSPRKISLTEQIHHAEIQKNTASQTNEPPQKEATP